jgi:hypothetical protein
MPKIPVITKSPSSPGTYAEIEPRYDWDRTGWVTVRRWRGLLTDVTGLTKSKIIGAPFKASITPEQYPWFVLECSYKGLIITGGPNQPPQGSTNPQAQVVTLYSLRSGFDTRTLWLLPKVAAEMRKITDLRARNFTRAMMDALIQGQITFDLPNSTGPQNYKNPVTSSTSRVVLDLPSIIAFAVSYAPTLNSKVLNDLFGAFARGVDGYRQEQVTFTMQQIAPPGASVVANYKTMQTVFTSAALLRTLNAQAQVPNIYTTAFQQVFGNGGWIGTGVDVAQIDAQRFQIDQGWIYVDDYEPFIYGNPIT